MRATSSGSSAAIGVGAGTRRRLSANGRANLSSRRFGLSFWSSAASIAFVGAVAFALPTWHVVSELLSDSYRTLYAGRWIAHHGIPHSEVFTIAAHGRAWVDQQWLAELVDYDVWSVGGYAGVAILAAGLIGVAYALLAGLMRSRGVSVVLTVCCCAVATVIALPSMFIRAQDFAYPLFALLMVLCLRDAEHDRPRRRMILVVPLLVVWANLHGSILVGAGLAVAYLAYRAAMMARRGWWRPAAGCGILAAAAAATPFATPYGFHILHYYAEVLGNPTIAAAVPENRPPSLSDPGSVLLFFLPLVIVVLLLIGSWLKRRFPPKLVVSAVALTAAATGVASRNSVWFGMTAAVLLADIGRNRLPTADVTRRFLAIMTATAAALTVLGVGLLSTRSNNQYEGFTPLSSIGGAAVYAEQHPCVRILGDNASASALLWHYPALAGRVEFDARLEQYPQRALARWINYQTATSKNWPTTLTGYQLLLGSTTYNPTLVRRLAHLPASTVLTQDSNGIAVVRNSGPSPRCASRAT